MLANSTLKENVSNRNPNRRAHRFWRTTDFFALGKSLSPARCNLLIAGRRITHNMCPQTVRANQREMAFNDLKYVIERLN